jgi:hypothetical protein
MAYKMALQLTVDKVPYRAKISIILNNFLGITLNNNRAGILWTQRTA